MGGAAASSQAVRQEVAELLGIGAEAVNPHRDVIGQLLAGAP